MDRTATAAAIAAFAAALAVFGVAPGAGRGGAAQVDPARGAAVFLIAGCGSCHAVVALGADGTVGPPLDGLGVSFDTAVNVVTLGSLHMPSFADLLGADQIDDVASFVSATGAGETVELLPDLDLTRPAGLAVATRRFGRERAFALRLTAWIENLGPGPLALEPAAAGGVAAQAVASGGAGERLLEPQVEVTARSDGALALRDVATVELRRATSGRVLRRTDVDACLGDGARAPREPDRGIVLPGAPAAATFDPVCTSGARRLGLSSGWGARLSTAIDVTGVPAGAYLLVLALDPSGALLEAPYAPNTAAALVRIRWPRGPAAAPTLEVLARCTDAADCRAGRGRPASRSPRSLDGPQAH